MIDVDALLQTHRPGWSFRDRQRDALSSVLNGHNTLCLMPTGTGKTLLFELATAARNMGCLVISPLIALMSEHASRLRDRGFSTLSLGGAGAQQATAAIRGWKFSGASFLFTSPERIEDDAYFEHRLRQQRHQIGLVVVDEVHCVSQWGYSFRPHYKRIPEVLDRVFGPGGWPPVLCLTATLSALDVEEVKLEFRIRPENVIRSASLHRDNLELRVERFDEEDQKLARLTTLLEEHRGRKLIVYTHRKESPKWGTGALAGLFARESHRTERFDADLSNPERDRIREAFHRSEIDVVFATGAFGMGIDIPDIRGVIHYLIPESVEQYHQEVGRAGRDGEPAFGHLLYTPTNIRIRHDLIRKGRPTAEKLEAFYASRIKDQRELIPATTFGDDYEALWLYALERVGTVRVIGKGPSNVRCFEPATSGSPGYERLLRATPSGRVVRVAAKLGLTIP